MKLSNTVGVMEPALSRELFHAALKDNQVINLTLGDPDLAPPENILQAASKAILCCGNHYSHNSGAIELRRVLADFIKRTDNAVVDPDKNIVVTVGAMEALYLSLMALINPGDEVIIPEPMYLNYRQMVRILGGVPVIVNTDKQNNFQVSREQLERVYSPKCRAVFVNSPGNPTGMVADYDTMKMVHDFAVEHDIMVIADEVYKGIVFEREKYHSFFEFGLEHAIIIDSTSKSFAMTGWRLGYIAAKPDLAEAISHLQENVVACAPMPAQYAAIEAYSPQTDCSLMIAEFRKRCNAVADILEKCSLFSLLRPQGGFYVWVDISKTGMKAYDFAFGLLRLQHVAVVPGNDFGPDFDGYIRLACTLPSEKLCEAAKRIVAYAEEKAK